MLESSSISGSRAESVDALAQWRRLWRGAPVLRWMIALLVVFELAAIVALPLLMPDSLALRLYLGQDSRRSIGRLLQDPETYLVWDAVTGWRNRPGLTRGKWRMDGQGARSTQGTAGSPDRDQVWYFGDSTVNGGLRVENDQTISAYSEDETLGCTNFGTMLFGLDQSFLQMRQLLGTSAPAAIVVGISENSLQALGNRFVPFRRRSESNMPFLKPRFARSESGLMLLETPARSAYEDLLGKASMLRELSTTDEYFGEFASFRRFGMTPIAGSLRAGVGRARDYWDVVTGKPLADPLMVPLMRAFDREVRERGAVLVFVALPDQVSTDPARLERLLPDRYGELLRVLASTGLEVVDGRGALLRSGAKPATLFGADRVHYSPDGNRLIAAEIRRTLAELGVGR